MKLVCAVLCVAFLFSASVQLFAVSGDSAKLSQRQMEEKRFNDKLMSGKEVKRIFMD